MSQTITLNTPGQNDGKMMVHINRKRVIWFDKVHWQSSENPFVFIGLDFATFFGGNDASYATPTDQLSMFKGFSITIEE